MGEGAGRYEGSSSVIVLVASSILVLAGVVAT